VIVVHTEDDVREFPSATRFSTEQDYNNLCIWSGGGEDLLAVFADGKWEAVEVIDG
jgi:hypothetical protein